MMIAMSAGGETYIPRCLDLERLLARRSVLLFAIEAKATRRVQRKHLRSLRALAEERLVERSIVVCREDRPRLEDGIEIWPLEFFLAALWDNGL